MSDWLIVGLAVLVFLAGLALGRRAARRRKVQLLGEPQGEVVQEEDFVPVQLDQDPSRRRVQEKVAVRPQRAADSIRGLLGQQPEKRPSTKRRKQP